MEHRYGLTGVDTHDEVLSLARSQSGQSLLCLAEMEPRLAYDMMD